MKKRFTTDSNLFVVKFEYGVNKEGYWCYRHIILQLEDCVVVVQTLYQDFYVLFMYNHSCYHDSQRDDALNTENMSKSYGWKQKKMSDTTMLDCTFFGPHPKILNEDDTHCMQYQVNDEGPFYLTPK